MFDAEKKSKETHSRQNINNATRERVREVNRETEEEVKNGRIARVEHKVVQGGV